MSSLQVHALRLGPGAELLSSLRDFVDQRRLRAPFVLTCVGSVTMATLRLANATADNVNEVLELSGRFEIVSLVGTLNPEPHLHVSLSDSRGRTVGGHVLGNLRVFTTAEVVIGEARSCCSPETWTRRPGSKSWWCRRGARRRKPTETPENHE
uniref:PPC domain-containing protein n=1 Tax=Neogobius melanostomus TaxID=47308 RepID=A0A8C6S8T1_9GOBI